MSEFLAGRKKWLFAAGLLAIILIIVLVARSGGQEAGPAIGEHIKGNEAAPLVLIEYGDFQCPACAAYYPIVKQLLQDYGQNLKIIYRHFPLTNIHPNAQPSAQAAEAAGLRGKFWEMHNLLYERQKEWSDLLDAKSKFSQYGRELGLDEQKFSADFTSKAVKNKINADQFAGRRANVQGTPSFFLNDGFIQPRSYEEFKAIIDSRLSSLNINSEDGAMEKISLKTSDNIDLSALYFPAASDKGALLLHMMPAVKESWQGLARRLQSEGYQVLAVDLRGHGESAGGPEGYKEFSQDEHEQSIMDVEAGVAFLEGKGAGPANLVLGGASIGANLALWHASEKNDVKKIILLSPGLNYHGIETEDLMAKLRPEQKVFIATSQDDDDNAAQSRRLIGLAPAGTQTKLTVYRQAGHGTDMFGKEEPDLEGEIINWLEE